jgi:hypothetical protein
VSILASISLVIALACAVWLAADELRHPQKMAVMNVVWPVSALYFSVFAVWAYYRFGREKERDAVEHTGSGPAQNQRRKGTHPGPSPAQIAVGTSHCGAGCALADVFCDFGIAATGFTLFGSGLWAEYAIDLAAAWAVGIVFQYWAIKPMRQISVGAALIAAMKADTLSILGFQVGMYALMAMNYFVFFPQPHLTAFDPRYWLMMQVAMACGFATSYPMNAWLLRKGWKDPM